MRRLRPTSVPNPSSEGVDPPSAEPEVREQVARNQVRTAAQWSETAEDMTLGNLVRAGDEQRVTRWQIVAALAVLVLVLLFGMLWTYNTIQHDRFVNAQRAAAERTPYVPETIR